MTIDVLIHICLGVSVLFNLLSLYFLSKRVDTYYEWLKATTDLQFEIARTVYGVKVESSE